MEITQSTTPGTGTNGGRSLVSNGDFETFLRMLTTQVQNQDPLSPMETNEFANQLAAFTMVEQQTLTNKTLEKLLSAADRREVGAYASMVGKTTVHEGPFFFSGQPASFEVSSEYTNMPVKISVLDETGTVVSEQSVPHMAEPIDWSGTGRDGLILDAGQYTVQLRSVADDLVLDAPVGIVSLVEEVRFDPTGVNLVMTNGSVVPEASILKLR